MLNKKQKLRKLADKLWQEKGMESYADDWGAVKCCVCDNNAYCLHHYYFKSSFSHLRYDFENAVPLCLQHHCSLHHGDHKRVEDLIVKEKGQKWLNKLRKKAYQRPEPSYLTQQYYENAIKELSSLRDAV